MQRNAGTDGLKIALAMMVVALHASLFTETAEYLNYIFVNGLLRIAVPTFFIINGFYFYPLIAKNRPFLGWAKRLGVLYGIWMMLYLPFYWPEHLEATRDQIGLLEKFIFGYHHLWYLVGTLGAGAVLYLLRRRSDKQLLVSGVALFVIGYVIQDISIYAPPEDGLAGYLFRSGWLFRNFLFFGFPLFSMGYLIAKHRLHKAPRRDPQLLCAIFVAALLLVLESTAHYYLHPLKAGVDMYLSLLLLCPLIFIFFHSRSARLNTDFLSKLSTAIYLTHVFFINILLNTGWMEQGTALFVMAMFASTVVSALLVWSDRKWNILF